MNGDAEQSRQTCRREILHHSVAWILLCLTLAIYIIDEAAGKLLPIYNRPPQSLSEHIPFLHLPDLTFEIWLTTIVMIFVMLFSLSFFAFLGMRWMRILSFPFAILAFANGMAHIAMAMYQAHAAPGTYAAPLLLGGAIYLLIRTHTLEVMAALPGSMFDERS
jgi:hypothetical protein